MITERGNIPFCPILLLIIAVLICVSTTQKLQKFSSDNATLTYGFAAIIDLTRAD